MSVPFIQDLIADDMRAVDAVIRRRLASEVALVREVAEYIVGSGGKRLRPALVILSAGAFGYRALTSSPGGSADPPVIKADTGQVKIVPPATPPASASSGTG